MRTNLFLVALFLAIICINCHPSSGESDDFSNFWEEYTSKVRESLRPQQQKTNTQVTFYAPSKQNQTTWRNYNSPKPSVSFSSNNYQRSQNYTYYQQPKKTNTRGVSLNRKSLWKVFDYLNKGYYASSQECRNGTLTSGCCMRGKFYTEEKCWIALLGMTAFATAFLVITLCCTLAVAIVLCCACCRRCKRVQQLKAAIASKIAQKKAQQAPVPPKSSYAPISVTAPKKCTCPPKKVESNTTLNSLKSSFSDFSYQPPKLSQPLIQKPQQAQILPVVENIYPQFEDVNPYPSFETPKVVAPKPVAQPQQAPKKVCTCKKNHSNEFDINSGVIRNNNCGVAVNLEFDINRY